MKAGATHPRHRGRVAAWEWAAVLLITILGAAFRLYRLPDLPPGLHFDEAFKGVTARDLLAGAPLRIFFESDMGEEPLAIYLVAASLALFGSDPWLIRLPSAIAGILTLPLTWWLGRELARAVLHESGPADWPGLQDRASLGSNGPTGSVFDTNSTAAERFIGLGAALILAILYWHVSFSRIGMEPILVPLFVTLALAALLRGLNTGSRPAFLLCGLALGGSLYTYKAGYLVPLLVALFLAWALLVQRGFLGRYGRRLLPVVSVALLVAAPLIAYFATHPANFLERPASVALEVAGAEGSVWQSVGENLPPVLGMFFVQGDANPRSNLPGRPALDPFLAVLFLLGLGWSLAHLRRAAAALPPLWLAVMALPTLLTDHAPHFGRAIGVVPALALLCALGGWVVWRTVVRLPFTWLRAAAPVGLAAGLLFSASSSARHYFVTWAGSANLFYAYDAGLADLARRINLVPVAELVYLTPTPADHFTLQYLVHRPLSSFDGRLGLVLPPPGRAATVVVLLREDGTTPGALDTLRPDGRVVWTAADRDGQAYAAAYHLPADGGTGLPIPGTPGLIGAFHPADFTFGPDKGRVRLLGYELDAESVRPGAELDLVLYWQPLDPLSGDYTAFAHLLGEYNPASGGPVWAGHDGQPVGGHYATGAWQPGETILDLHRLAVPAATPPSSYSIEAGLYLLATLERLPAWDGAGRRLTESGDAALLGTVQVAP